MKQFKVLIAVFILSVVTFMSCNKDETVLPEGKGRINVLITDSPFPVEMVGNAIVTIDRVEVRHRDDVNQGEDADSFIVISETEMEIDLLQLTNGITEEIASADLEAGYYDMIRLHVVDATVILADGTEFDLKVPSGDTSGLKIKLEPAIYLDEGQTSDVLLDFDVSRSFVVRGNPMGVINGFIFKPVVRGVYLGAAGRIEGTVTDTASVALEDALVRLYQDENENGLDEQDSVLVSSFSDQDGNYKLIGVPEGIYSILCELDGYENDTIENVSVTQGNSTEVNIQLE
jgi:hypothetical protein